ncbi:hypothetical protein COCON_G00232230 [Conger conger]|uniref:Gamma-tubulin complex component 6 n=1 Tax=Conger conger TaxID=82655 RepID=A0A9Q1HMD4_CONCO|nr:hypothetical protein COCON_G00232230 [Conger conger]
MALGETDVADGYPKTMNRGPGVPASASCSYSSSSSITELLGALCDTFVSGVSWTLPALRSGSGSGSVERFRRDLRRRAYGVLLSTLFQDGSPKGLPGPLASTPPRNKVLMLSFNLRVSGRQEEAERLEELLGALGDGRGSGLAELNSVLELLVQLAGSVPPPPTSFSRDYGRWERPVTRRPPVGSYLSAELLRLEARTWALVTAEESGAMGCLGGSLGLMDAPPGSGLLFLGRRGDAEERFEKETRTSLFGALQHSRTSDLDVRLDLPPVPSNADVAGLALRVPPALDQSEDEGFRSDSNPTPDSQSAPSPGPDLDVWEALHDFQPSHRRCWEMVGCPPGSKEKPFLTEGGRQAFDQLYRLVERNVRTLSSGPASPPIPPPRDSESQLVGDLLNVLMGVPSATFPLNPTCAQFEVRPGVCISGASPESLSRLLGDLAQYGTHYLRLSRFSLQGAQRRGLVFQAFTGGLMRYLQYYCACVLSTPNTLSLLTICFQFRKLGSQLRYLSELCCLDGASPAAGQATFPVGCEAAVCEPPPVSEAQSNCSNENYPQCCCPYTQAVNVLNVCDPYTRFVSDWVYSGVFRDVYGEFMIQVNEDHLGCRDKHFWSEGYTLISRSVEENVPVFLRHLANDVYVCGKTINLLKICCPQHYICRSELPVPRIAVTVSLRELEEVERDCAVYRSRMGQVARHSVVTREEQAQRMERARQELISQVRASTAKTLESIRGLQVSQRLAEGARKRERFVELKQQLEMEQERRGAAQRKEQEDEFGFLRELQDRERRLQALQEAQEHRARKELIDQYSQLTEEAAKRERRALWRVQRMRLHQDRVRLLQEDRRLIQALLEQYPLGQPGPPTVPQTSARTQRPSQASGEVVQDTPTGPQETPTGPQETPTGLQAPPSPAEEEALISDELDIRDFLPKPGPALDEQEVDRALQDIGSDLPQVPALAQDYDFSAPYVPLQGSPTLPTQPPPPRPSPLSGPETSLPRRGQLCRRPRRLDGSLGRPSPLIPPPRRGAGCVVTGSRELRGAGPEAGPEAGAHVEPEWPVEGAEQDYLASLASQYEVERYQDPYALLALAPGSQTLQQVVRGPYRPPGVLSLDKAADGPAVELSEMVPLPVLMKLSVTTPLITHVSLVNKAVVDYFFVELGVERHFEALRHFLLMEDGEFAQSLSDLLFEKLRSGPTPGELLTPLVLNSILSKALQYSLHGDIALASSFSFALRFVPETFHPLAPDALNCLELRYKVDWPLNIIITDSCMNKYNRLFSFLLQLKHMVWTLRDVWFHLKALVKGAGSSVQFRQLQLYRHEMQHFVKVIQGYIADQILQVSWNEFTHKLGNVHDLDAIHHTHADYLNRAIFRGLLTDKAAPVMNIIHSIFSLILKFRAQLIAQPWSRQQGELVHPSFVALQQFYNTFKYYSHFLFKVVTKLVDRGYQPHLEDFLLRINFNNYYKET